MSDQTTQPPTRDSDSAMPDVAGAIEQDLFALQQEKRRHFAPALALAVVGLGGTFALLGARPDLAAQPPWQLGIQILLWLMCLGIFPAIGLGLIFPGKWARVGLAVGGVLLTIAATLGWPFDPIQSQNGIHIDGCVGMLSIFGVSLVGLGIFSGAFVQRRRSSNVFWIAAGASLAALSAITWHCPKTGAEHVMPNHLGGAVALMLLASIVGLLTHRRRRAT